MYDEENHDLALGYIANAYGVDAGGTGAEALRLREAWTCASRLHNDRQSDGCRASDFLCTTPVFSS